MENFIFIIYSLARFEKTNEMLGTCCALSNHRLESSKRELIWYTQMLGEMKKDLESIFRRIKYLFICFITIFRKKLHIND